MPTLSRETYISVFETWLELLNRHPKYQEVAGPLTAAFQDCWRLLPEGEHAIEAYCAILEQPLLIRLGGAGMLPVWKSSYLYRRLYMGQHHRNDRCPRCAGAWSGYPVCSLCGNTGWLPAEGS